MGAVILNGAEIGDNCIIGAGATVTQNKKIPQILLLVGCPAKVIKRLTPKAPKVTVKMPLNMLKRARNIKIGILNPKGDNIMSECTHDCSSCHADCDSRANVIEKEKPHELSHIKKVIGVVSGKGGVGKSLVTSLMAVSMQRRGYKSAVLDADITGPSIPAVFGLNEHATGDDNGLYPVNTKTGIEVMSINLFCLKTPPTPVVWRGPCYRRCCRYPGTRSFGTMSTLCLSICLPERATFR